MELHGWEIVIDFMARHPNCRNALHAWKDIVLNNDFSHLPDLKTYFSSADYAKPYTIFNIGGNNYRLIARVQYEKRALIINYVFTHQEYDRWNKGGRH